MPGKAYRIKDFTSGRTWYQGTSLYKVIPPVSVRRDDGFLTRTSYVIVVFSPSCVDHKKPEIKIFAARANGSLFNGDLDGGDDLMYPGIRLEVVSTCSGFIISISHQKALLKLEGGYLIRRKLTKEEEEIFSGLMD